MKHIICILAGTLSVAMCQNIPWLTGRWKGEGNQPEAMNQDTWAIEFTFTPKGEATIYYPSFPCGGSWKLITWNNDSAVFIEILDNGLDKCMNNGMVTVYPLDNRYLRFIYYHPNYPDMVIAKAAVRKEDE